MASSAPKAPQGASDHKHQVVASFQPDKTLEVTESELTDLRNLGVVQSIDGVDPAAFDKKAEADEKKAAAAADDKKES